MNHSWIVPDWPAPSNVRALQTTRHGGSSAGLYTSMNLGDHVGDDPVLVAQNRAMLRAWLPDDPVWLKQVHGNAVADADHAIGVPEADAAVAHKPGTVCAVLTADCLPVLLCDHAGTVVGAAHAGWRGLAGGAVEAAVRAMGVEPASLMAWLGPAIGPQVFEVGEEVRQAFMAHDPEAAKAFVSCSGRPLARHVGLKADLQGCSAGDTVPGVQKWLADIYLLARQRLALMGVERVYGSGLCTYGDSERFFSYRRDGATGRMASLVWLDSRYPV